MLFTINYCCVHKTVVCEGSQNVAVKSEKQHNFVYGLASEKTSDTQEMAKGAKDYDVITSHSFVDGLINGLTLGFTTQPP